MKKLLTGILFILVASAAMAQTKSIWTNSTSASQLLAGKMYKTTFNVYVDTRGNLYFSGGSTSAYIQPEFVPQLQVILKKGLRWRTMAKKNGDVFVKNLCRLGQAANGQYSLVLDFLSVKVQGKITVAFRMKLTNWDNEYINAKILLMDTDNSLDKLTAAVLSYQKVLRELKKQQNAASKYQ